MTGKRALRSGPPFLETVLAGIIILVVGGFILAYLQGWLLPRDKTPDLPQAPPSSPDGPLLPPFEPEFGPETTALDTEKTGDHRASSRQSKDSTNHSKPIIEEKPGNSERYSLVIYYEEDAQTKANNIREYLKRYKELKVDIEKFQRNGIDEGEYSIQFLYRDATQEKVAQKIWANLVTKFGNIEKRIDSTIDTEFKIVIEYRKEETP
jgi:hypothetical protein